MRWIVIIALFAIGPVRDVLSWVLPGNLVNAAFLYGGVGAAGVAVFRLVGAWRMPLWIGLAGLALPLLYALKALILGAPLYALTPFLLFNLCAVALLTLGSWTRAMLEWGEDNKSWWAVATWFVFPALFALCAFPLAGYLHSFMPDRYGYTLTTGEWLIGFIGTSLVFFGVVALITAAGGIILIAWLSLLYFLHVTGFRSSED